MSNGRLLPPGEHGTRPLTSNKQRVSNIEGPLRYPELGGFAGPAKVGNKTPFKQVKPGNKG